MARKRDTVYLTGKFYWAKIFGAPRTNYNEDGKEWTFEFEPDEASTAELTSRGLGDRLKDGRKRDGTMRAGYEGRAPFLILKRNELDYEGKPNDPIRVVDAANAPWNEKTLLGNGTAGDVKVNIVDYGPGKFDGIYPQAIRVLELVPYVSEEFPALPSEDPRVKKAKAKADDFRKDFDMEEEDTETQEDSAPAETAATDDLEDDPIL